MPINPAQTAFVFPGQGSQTVGMGAALAEEDHAAAQVFSQADDILGYSISKLCWEGPDEKLNDTLHTQPALLTHSVAVLRAFQAQYPDFEPAFTAGHSLGEFSALVASGALTFPDALRLVEARGKAMKAAGERQPGGMAAVLGLEVEDVDQVCEQVSRNSGGGVWVANDNCPGQVVISGDEGALSAASEHLLDRGAKKVVRLAVSIASHTPLMKPALDDFDRALQTTQIQDPQIAIVGNVEAKPLHSAVEVRADLSAQLTARVRWTESIRSMLDSGVTTFIELGPKNVLTSLIRRIERSAAGMTLDAPTSLAAFHEMH
ncbi:MAG: ACP S-malonyltransferase [Anaerolineales bacterium]|nr:ACP S-malonyltransferase [Anaerolineales bacterium]